jgi:hypothetical protein
MEDGVRNSEGTDAHRGTRFGGLGRVRVSSTMLRTCSNEGSMLVLLERSAGISIAAVASGSYFGCHGFRYMLCHWARGGDKNETAHGRVSSVCLDASSICCASLISRSSVIKLALKLHGAKIRFGDRLCKLSTSSSASNG